MASIIVPRRLQTGDDFADFITSGVEGRETVMVQMLPQLSERSSEDEHGLIKVMHQDPKVIQDVFDWAADPMPSPELLNIINSIKFVCKERSGPKVASPHTNYFLESDTPEGRITFRLRVHDNAEKGDGQWIGYWGSGSLAPDFLFFDASHEYNAWMANAIHSALVNVGVNFLWDMELSKISFSKLDSYEANLSEENHTVGKELLKARLAVSYPAAAEAIKNYPTQWIKVGHEMSGASLVTRIRKGEVSVFDPSNVEVRAVKSESGKFSVWVAYSPEGSQTVGAYDLDGQAEVAWERFSETMREVFIREFKLSHSLGSDKVA